MKNLTLVLATLAIIPMSAFANTSNKPVKANTLVECGIFGTDGRYVVLRPENKYDDSYDGLIFLLTDPKETAYLRYIDKALVKNGYEPLTEGRNYCIVTNRKTNKTVSVYEY